MLRIALVAAFAFAASASAAAQGQAAPRKEARGPEIELETVRRDRFVISNDACGASRYEHLLGEPYAELHQAALPANAAVWGRGGAVRTLEFRPGQLNVIVDGEGRIIAIGCF